MVYDWNTISYSLVQTLKKDKNITNNIMNNVLINTIVALLVYNTINATEIH